MTFHSIALCLFLSLTAWSCASAPTPEEQREIDRNRVKREVDDEIMVGRHIAARLLGHFGNFDTGPSTAPAMEYVNLVGRTLAAQSGRPEIQFKFGILNTDEINAFACPGGYIFVTKGLLKITQNESELAGVLGHEIAHVNEKHMYSEIIPKREVSTNEALVRLMSQGKSDIGGNLSKIVDQGMKMLLEKGFAQEKEDAADRAGTLYLFASNYDPTALGSLIRRMAQNPALKVGKTHPPYPLRVEKIQKFISENGLTSKPLVKEKELQRRFQAQLKSIGGKTP